MIALLAATESADLTASCVIWAIVLGLLVGGLAWLIPPSRPYCVAVGGVVAILVILSCLL